MSGVILRSWSWSLVVGRWSLVVSNWLLVCWSLVVGRWSLVVGRWSMVMVMVRNVWSHSLSTLCVKILKWRSVTHLPRSGIELPGQLQIGGGARNRLYGGIDCWSLEIQTKNQKRGGAGNQLPGGLGCWLQKDQTKP